MAAALTTLARVAALEASRLFMRGAGDVVRVTTRPIGVAGVGAKVDPSIRRLL
ncbi:hypothetical protein D3C85_1551060 [compost metagenome]